VGGRFFSRVWSGERFVNIFHLAQFREEEQVRAERAREVMQCIVIVESSA
jgi:hypothetical protein